MQEFLSSTTGVIVIILAFVMVGFVIAKSASSGSKSRSSRVASKRPQYKYAKKKYFMTNAERQFYERLHSIFGDKLYIFPQAHLPSFLNHAVKGQNWKGALSTIQRKSVDYVLCDKANISPIIAIELDDWSHDAPNRQQRDTLVGAICEQAGMPLVRFRDVSNLSSRYSGCDQREALRAHS